MADNLLAIYSYPPSEYTTADEMRQERISQGLGWDTSRPGREFLRRAITQLPLAMGATPNAMFGSVITGGKPYLYPPVFLPGDYPPIAYSSAGMVGRNPGAFRSIDDMGVVGPQTSVTDARGRLFLYMDPVNRNSMQPRRGWWLHSIPGKRE